MPIVRVTNPGVVMFNGAPTPLRLDEPFDSKDDIVRAFPHMFGVDNPGVETATAAPGERRK